MFGFWRRGRGLTANGHLCPRYRCVERRGYDEFAVGDAVCDVHLARFGPRDVHFTNSNTEGQMYLNNAAKATDLFGDPSGSMRERGQGSGVIIDAGRGLVLTNAHVVEGARRIQVLLAPAPEEDEQRRSILPLVMVAALLLLLWGMMGAFGSGTPELTMGYLGSLLERSPDDTPIDTITLRGSNEIIVTLQSDGGGDTRYSFIFYTRDNLDSLLARRSPNTRLVHVARFLTRLLRHLPGLRPGPLAVVLGLRPRLLRPFGLRPLRLRGTLDDCRRLLPQLALQYDAVIDDSGDAVDEFARLGKLGRQRRRGDGQHAYGTRACA